ncbi:MAG TPA: protein kinase, partial [Candidatus Limnocylindrales bacterium]
MTEPRTSATPDTSTESSGAGRLVAGRYRLGPIIGRGGMATIHRATDIRLDRQVAVKLLRPDVRADADLAQRFRREALAATVLRHPNIVACLDTGTDGDQPFLVMDLVEGEDLAARLRRGGRLGCHLGLGRRRLLQGGRRDRPDGETVPARKGGHTERAADDADDGEQGHQERRPPPARGRASRDGTAG